MTLPSAEALTRYRSDPRRDAVRDLLHRSGARVELHHVRDVPTA
jgi:hypothetical protein